MPLRPAHGNAKRNGRLVVNESLSPLRLPNALEPEPALPTLPERRNEHGQFVKGNKAAKGKRRRHNRFSATMKELEAGADPNWVASRRWAKDAAKHRFREYCEFHGAELSSGIGAMLAESSEMRADANYVRARAMKDDSIELLRIAAQLSAGARQSERDAWELAVREADARRKNKKNSLESPLLGALAEGTEMPDK